MTTALLEELARRPSSFDAVVPRDGSGLQPLCAVYGRRALAALEQMLDADERRIDRVFERVRTDYVDVADGRFGDPRELFFNVNTPADLEAARRRAERLAPGRPAAPGASPPAAHLALSVLDFLSRVPLPTVSIMGKKKSGKTTVLVGVIEELSRRGRRVAAVKHDMHGFELDVAGTDTDRLRRAGAVVTAISSPFEVAVMSASRRGPAAALAGRAHPRAGRPGARGGLRAPAGPQDRSLAGRPQRLADRAARRACSGSSPTSVFPTIQSPSFGLDDFSGVADLLESLLPTSGGVARRRKHWRACCEPTHGEATPC